MSSSRKIFDETKHVHPSTGLLVTELMLAIICVAAGYCWGHHDGSAKAQREAEASVRKDKQ
jgi:hypothetical protein